MQTKKPKDVLFTHLSALKALLRYLLTAPQRALYLLERQHHRMPAIALAPQLYSALRYPRHLPAMKRTQNNSIFDPRLNRRFVISVSVLQNDTPGIFPLPLKYFGEIVERV